MKIAYVFGPLTAKTPEGVRENIAQADKVARALVAKGYGVIVPHNNTGLWFGDDVASEEFFRDMYCRILEKCDLLVSSGVEWHSSRGSRREVALAKVLDIPVYLDEGSVPPCRGIAEPMRPEQVQQTQQPQGCSGAPCGSSQTQETMRRQTA